MSHVVGLHEYSYAEYLPHDKASNGKHDYLNGEIDAIPRRLTRACHARRRFVAENPAPRQTVSCVQFPPESSSFGERARVEVWGRDGDSWTHHGARAGARVALRSIECELAVDELYRDVFEP